MSVSRPARCLFAGPSIPKTRPRIRYQNFHSSAGLCERRRPRTPNVLASDMGLRAKEKKQEAAQIAQKQREEDAKHFAGYTDEQRAKLGERYTPAQLRAIEAGEKAIDPVTLGEQGTIRTDLGALRYYEDFSKTQATIDRPQRYEGPLDPSTRPMTDEEILAREKFYLDKIIAEKSPPPDHLNPDSEEYQKLLIPTRIDQLRAESLAEAYVDKNGPVPLNKIGYSYEAPGLPINVFGKSDRKTKALENDDEKVDERDPSGIYTRVMKQTGMTLTDIMDLKVKVLVSHRVVNQTRLGKIASQYCLAVAGNGKGLLGIGEAKGQEVVASMDNARITAIRSMKPVPRYEERTIYGEVEAKVSAVKVHLRSRPPGFGLRCHHSIFEMARAAGISDLSAKVPRSRNPMNTVKAAYQALMNQRVPDEVARGLGKKLVDVRKVYYGGRV